MKKLFLFILVSMFLCCGSLSLAQEKTAAKTDAKKTEAVKETKKTKKVKSIKKEKSKCDGCKDKSACTKEEKTK
jgi:hypothetical protein